MEKTKNFHNDSCNPRQQFGKALRQQIQFLEANRDELILMLDANADFDDEEFFNIVSLTQMVDLHEGLHTNKMPSTYNRGNRKLDYILGTGKISAAVTKGDMTTYADGLKFSDHRALFIDLQETKDFNDKGKDITARKHRGLSTKNKDQVKVYLKLVKKQLTAHNIFERCRKLKESAPHMQVQAIKRELDSIYTQVTIAVLHAERMTSRVNFGRGWSPQLAKAGKEVTFWKNCLRCHKKGRGDPVMQLPKPKLKECGLTTSRLERDFFRNKLDDAWLR